ncbi:hypothetical protein [Halegenticoccus tardaugens]|uniref:hypothetical protein n=1 Tax=Halegenticoccus tardaugens TaxID=2071624 RepID=UPI00100B16D3|nr:hypothetical protein [Halegenticoccus tardaugens]
MSRKVNWRPRAGVERVKNARIVDAAAPTDGEDDESDEPAEPRSFEVWTHSSPHIINDGEVDGDVSFDDELKERVLARLATRRER